MCLHKEHGHTCSAFTPRALSHTAHGAGAGRDVAGAQVDLAMLCTTPPFSASKLSHRFLSALHSCSLYHPPHFPFISPRFPGAHHVAHPIHFL
eukprot:105695-Chlamydomonas_euryale.AAC.2